MFELGELSDEDLTVFRRQRIGFVFQNYNLVPVLNVYENTIGLLLGYLLGAVLVPMMTGGIGKEAAVSVNPYIFIGSALFAYLTVLISCGKPARIAGKVSPMEALRYTNTGTQSKHKMKKGKNGASIPGMAFANLGRNKKRTFIMIE